MNGSSDLVSSYVLETNYPKNQAFSEFPERPEAFRNFLLGLRHGWNISLFHYRNHGAGISSEIINKCYNNRHSLADVGKVLAGIQVPPTEYDEFDKYLTNLNYTYVEETQNEVYKRYLRG